MAEVPSVVHAPPEPLEPPPLDTLTIMLDWYPSLHQAPLLLAAGNGLPRREGLSLEIRRPADPAAPLPSPAAAADPSTSCGDGCNGDGCADSEGITMQHRWMCDRE